MQRRGSSEMIGDPAIFLPVYIAFYIIILWKSNRCFQEVFLFPRLEYLVAHSEGLRELSD